MLRNVSETSASDLDLPIDEAASPSIAPASPSTMPPEETLPANQTTTRPIGSSFSDLGATFNGMARPSIDASSQNARDQGGQGTGSLAHDTNDLTTVQNNVLAQLHSGQFSGAALGHVQAILSDITSAISAANATASTAGAFGNTAGAEQALRASQLSIINTVNTDPVLANPRTGRARAYRHYGGRHAAQSRGDRRDVRRRGK